MGELVKIPPGLQEWLLSARAAGGGTWYDIWKPLKKAIDAGKPLSLQGNTIGYSYDPATTLISVYAILPEFDEVHIPQEKFQKTMAPYLRGTPEC
ncbi:hypothetical protein [Neogemmobacter tilapiae]|uniref:Uncharacterized protein n=1 Tax=Neogemmobacter tilapiae TaxID=875041 RepID=A0A918TQP5_9RHOB|nr:hypothetical protein [Gemmobacter tilapiae]GHC58952.1 hypothetical protein GCM10007315_23490 [Gemmobacter tilapiae]